MCMNGIFCSRAKKPKALEPFADIEPQIEQMKTLRVDNLRNFIDEGFTGAASNRLVYDQSLPAVNVLIPRVVKMSTTVKADAGILQYAMKTYRKSYERLKGIENLIFSITFEPLPVSIMEQSIARGGNSLGLKPSDGTLVVVLLYTSWDSPSHDEKGYDVNKEALGAIEKEAQSKGVSASYRYMKYAFPGQDAISSYGLESKPHLRAVSERCNPESFFQIAGVGPFKIPM